MNDFFEFLGLLAVVFALFVGAAAGIANWQGSYQCGNYQAVTGVETKWVSFDQCYIKAAPGWMPWSEYKARAFTNQ